MNDRDFFYYDTRDWLLTRMSFYLAKRTVKEIVDKVRQALIKMQGDAYGIPEPLLNAWEALCAQVQDEHFIEWYAYEETILGLINGYLPDLSYDQKVAIWLQTKESYDWPEDEDVDPFDEDKMPNTYNSSDEVQYYILDAVYSEADDYTNDRIEAFKYGLDCNQGL